MVDYDYEQGVEDIMDDLGVEYQPPLTENELDAARGIFIWAFIGYCCWAFVIWYWWDKI